MATLNGNYSKLQAGYLFPEIAKRTREFAAKNPDAQIMRLGIGDTSEPLAASVVVALRALPITSDDGSKGSVGSVVRGRFESPSQVVR